MSEPKEFINPKPLISPGPAVYSHVAKVNRGTIVYISGQVPSDASGKIIGEGNFEAQVEQVFANLKIAVEAAGGVMADIVKLNVFVTSRDDYVAQLKPLGKLFCEYFGNYYPAMALFEVVGLFQPDAMIEMEGFAVLGTEEKG